MEIGLVLPFISSVVLLVIGAVLGSYVTSRREHSTQLTDRRHRIYVRLLEVRQEHFWISSGDMPEMPDRAIEPEAKWRYYEAIWRVADELRGADDLPQLPAIVDALFSLRFEHEWQRAEATRKVIDDLGRDVSPRFLAAMKERDREAEQLMMSNTDEWWHRRSKIEPFMPYRRRRGGRRTAPSMPAFEDDATAEHGENTEETR